MELKATKYKAVPKIEWFRWVNIFQTHARVKKIVILRDVMQTLTPRDGQTN